MVHRKLALNLAGIAELSGAGFAGVLQAAVLADQLGVDMLVVPDHLALSEAAHSAREGFPYPIDLNWYEPVAALAAIAAVTDRARLGTSVLVAPLRPPLLLAKQLATLDAISGGRMELSLGIGWQRPEFEANGTAFDDRFGAFEEQIRVCRALWAGGPASHDGPRWPFADLHSYPLPVQGSAIPLHLGGKLTPRHAERIARYADGWAPAPTTPEALRSGIADLRDAASELGRDWRELTVTATAPLLPHGQRAVDAGEPHPAAFAEESWAAGADVVQVDAVAFCSSLDDLSGFLAPLLEVRAA